MRYSRSAMYHKKGKWAIKNRATGQKDEGAKVIEKTFGKKNPSKRIVDQSPKFYPTEDVRRPLASSRRIQHPTRLRKGITPGTVLILLSGKHAGKRVVFIRQLASGLLLISGKISDPSVPFTTLPFSISSYLLWLIKLIVRTLQAQWSPRSTSEPSFRYCYLHQGRYLWS